MLEIIKVLFLFKIAYLVELGQQKSLKQMRTTPHFLCIQVLSGDQLEYLERDYPSTETNELYYDDSYFMNTTVRYFLIFYLNFFIACE